LFIKNIVHKKTEKIPSKKTLFSSLECPYLGMLLGLSQQQKREKLEKEMNLTIFTNVKRSLISNELFSIIKGPFE